MKKILVFIFVVIIIGMYFLVMYMPKNYKTNYIINNYKIKEEYFKDNKVIEFEIIKDNINYNFSLNKNYNSKRQIIKSVKEFNDNNITCIYPIINKINTYPLCKVDNESIHFSLIKNELFTEFLNKNYLINNDELNKEYENIEIYSYDDSVFLIWNYDRLLYISEKENKQLILFDSEVLDTNLISKIGNYLVIPNYNEKYNFSSFYIININKFEKELWEIDEEISYNSYILGVYDDQIYLVDRKNKLQYKINPHKKKISIVNKKDISPLIYSNGWKNISINKLINKDYNFEFKQAFKFSYEEDKLKLLTFNEYQTTLLDEKNINIISDINNKIYYIKNDELYVFDIFTGNKRLIKYFEWNFNFDNKIFIYNK